jgi:hypothetical protein
MSLDLMGLTDPEVQQAIRSYASEKQAAQERGRRRRENYEAFLRRQGYTEEQIRRRTESHS